MRAGSGRIIPLGVGFVAGMVGGTLAAVLTFVLVHGPIGLGGQLATWLAGAFIGAAVAQRLGARLSAWHAGVFGLAIAVVNGFMALGAPVVYLLGTAAGSVVTAVVGATVVRPRPGSSVSGHDAKALAPATPVPTLLELAKEERRRRESGEPPLPPPGPRPRSFAERTGQTRRLRLAQSLAISGGVAFLVSWFVVTGPVRGVAAIVGMVLSAVGLVGECLAVWCPRCGTSVVWHTFLTRKASEAHMAAVQQVTCPKCGYEPELPQ